jgi:integrase
MATIRKRNGKYQARIQRRGFPTVARTFLTHRDAQQWARKMEVNVERTALSGLHSRTTVRDLVLRYADEISPTKKGAKSEILRLKTWSKSQFGAVQLSEVRTPMLARWRDERLNMGRTGSTVRNDLNTLSAVFRHAISEWGYEGLENPVAALRRPRLSPGRTRRVTDTEIAAVKRLTASICLPMIIDLAVETAMRLSELVTLRWQHINLPDRTVYLPETKNGYSRVIPLSSHAVTVFHELQRKQVSQVDTNVFNITSHSITVAFRRAAYRLYRDSDGQLGKDLRFHDLRHEAVSRLFERGLNPIEVASISGHRSIQVLARYTHIRIESLLAKLN